LFPKKVDVQTTHGKWYKMHIQPYRTLDNVIEGAVITFVDITEIKQANEMLLKVNELFNLSVVSRDANIAITVQDLNGRILAWNQGATRLYGWSETEALAMNSRVRVPEKILKEALSVIKQSDQGKVPEPYLSQRITKDDSVIDVWITTMPLLDETGRIYAIATTERKADTMVL
jgi:two-component system CheB/CheR fusion protein